MPVLKGWHLASSVATSLVQVTVISLLKRAMNLLKGPLLIGLQEQQSNLSIFQRSFKILNQIKKHPPTKSFLNPYWSLSIAPKMKSRLLTTAPLPRPLPPYGRKAASGPWHLLFSLYHVPHPYPNLFYWLHPSSLNVSLNVTSSGFPPEPLHVMELLPLYHIHLFPLKFLSHLLIISHIYHLPH